jgi:lipid II:glycine glycyltransferase (peptidoglycan interpeptide bridge formation enzyme)
LVLNLKLSEVDLLAGMHTKTRYNIRVAQRKGVKIRFSCDVRDLDLFAVLAQEVHARSPFRYHPISYYRAMLEALTDDCALEIGVAEHNGRVLAVHLFVTFAGTTTYLHGASGNSQRHLMAPHLLHWEAVRRAQERGSSSFDFYGVAPIGFAPTHPWAGITRYKEGFGGARTTTIGAYEYVMHRPKMWLYAAAHSWR